MGPRPSGSGTSRKRPSPRASTSSGWPQSTQWRGGRLEGGNGTWASLPPLSAPRDFSAAQLLAPAAAAGALEVLDELLDDEPESDEPPLLDDVELPLLDEDELLLDDDELPSFLVELYRSEYQPPPLRTKLERLTTLLSESLAPHAEQVSGVGSLTFCRTSIVFPQDLQAYS